MALNLGLAINMNENDGVRVPSGHGCGMGCLQDDDSNHHGQCRSAEHVTIAIGMEAQMNHK